MNVQVKRHVVNQRVVQGGDVVLLRRLNAVRMVNIAVLTATPADQKEKSAWKNLTLQSSFRNNPL